MDQHLHACGLLRGSFRPDDEICAIRSLWRHRDNLIELATIHLQHMQKALDQMNVQLHHVISDLAGTTGLAIVDAILAGERDPGKLAQLRDWRIKASKDTIMKSLVGDYREEHVFTLRQSLKSYRHYQGMIEEVDLQVKERMQRLPSRVEEGADPPKEKNPRKTPWRNEPPQLRDDLYRAFGVDLTQVPGINTLTAQMLLTEVGPDLSRFPTAAAFCSWLRLCPASTSRRSSARRDIAGCASGCRHGRTAGWRGYGAEGESRACARLLAAAWGRTGNDSPPFYRTSACYLFRSIALFSYTSTLGWLQPKEMISMSPSSSISTALAPSWCSSPTET